MSEQLNTRNIEALAQGLRHLQEQISSLNKVVNDVRAENAMLRVRLDEVQSTVNIMRIKGMGRGPTT
jgi:predicted RNase H-like nuclease (RuvC/YqgF family)